MWLQSSSVNLGAAVAGVGPLSLGNVANALLEQLEL